MNGRISFLLRWGTDLFVVALMAGSAWFYRIRSLRRLRRPRFFSISCLLLRYVFVWGPNVARQGLEPELV